MPADDFLPENSLEVSQYRQIDKICLEFEEQWRDNKMPSLQEFLDRLDESPSVRAVLFRELLALDWHYRRRKQVDGNSSQYTGHFPEYAAIIAQVCDEGQQAAEPMSAAPFDTHQKAGDPAASTSRSSSPDAAPLPPPTAAPPRQRLGPYQVLRPIGKGAFGEVYQARDPHLDRIVAIKVCHSDTFSSRHRAKRFLREARAAAKVSEHAGIVTVHNVQQEGGQYFIVMDYLPGGSLADAHLARSMPWQEKAELIARVADAVHYAHTHGLVHRDIKPANILLDAAGRPQVADFGLALHESEQNRKQVEISGTPHYMSPEQVEGHTERLDGRSDIWSLGATLYELLTGRRPFQGNSAEEVFDQILQRDPKPLRQIDDTIPIALERVCLKALSKQPAKRHSTARDLADDLRQLVMASVLPGTAQSVGKSGSLPTTPSAEYSPPIPWRLLCAVGVLICAGVLAATLLPNVWARVAAWLGPPPAVVTQKTELLPTGITEFVRLGKALGQHTCPITTIASSQSGTIVASGDESGTLRRWDLRSRLRSDPIQMKGRVRMIGVSESQDRMVLLVDDAATEVRSLSDLKVLSPSRPTVQTPIALVTVPEGIVVLTAAPSGMQWYRIPDQTTGSLDLGNEWQFVVSSAAEGRLVLAGCAANGGWRIVQGKFDSPGTLEDVPFHQGPVCSVAVAGGGRVVVGGYSDSVGIQLCDPNGNVYRLLGDVAPSTQLYYHQVAIAPAGDYAYAASRWIVGGHTPEQVLLRAWYVGKDNAQHRACELIASKILPGPLQAVAFDPEKRHMLLAVSHELTLWEIPGIEQAHP